MKREVLLQALNAVKPAIGSTVAQLALFWFADKTVTTFNDKIGLSAPCDVPLAAGVPVKLLDFLEASREVDELTVKAAANGNFTLRLGQARLNVETMPLSDRIFEMPEPVEPFTVTQDLLDALRQVQLSLPEKSMQYEVVGITLAREDRELAAYATDAKSISWSRVALPKKCKLDRVVLSGAFVTEVLRHCQPGAVMEVADQALAVAGSGVRILGRLVAPPKELDFAGVIAENIGDAYNTAVPMPEGLRPALDRAIVELKWMGDGLRPAKITVAKREMQIELGSFHELVALAEDHPSAKGFFDVEMLRRAVEEHQWISVGERFVMLRAGVDAGYVLSGMADPK
jgi:hypothetical protein